MYLILSILRSQIFFNYWMIFWFWQIRVVFAQRGCCTDLYSQQQCGWITRFLSVLLASRIQTILKSHQWPFLANKNHSLIVQKPIWDIKIDNITLQILRCVLPLFKWDLCSDGVVFGVAVCVWVLWNPISSTQNPNFGYLHDPSLVWNFRGSNVRNNNKGHVPSEERSSMHKKRCQMGGAYFWWCIIMAHAIAHNTLQKFRNELGPRLQMEECISFV